MGGENRLPNLSRGPSARSGRALRLRASPRSSPPCKASTGHPNPVPAATFVATIACTTWPKPRRAGTQQADSRADAMAGYLLLMLYAFQLYTAEAASDYPSNCSAVCGTMLACASTEVPALTRIWLRVKRIVSRAISASRIALSDAAAFSS